MRRFWFDVTEPILRQRGISHVVEIGSQSGESTRRLLELCKELGAHADIIDPLPPANEEEIGPLLAAHGKMHLARSLDVLPELPVADAYLIDGDHNWYTVHHELLTIEDRVQATGSRPPVILMHDVGWPYARRDLYYDPETVPAEARQPWVRGGVHPGQVEVDPDGGMNRHLSHAKLEGGPKNGVRTGVDDFLEARPDRYRWSSLSVFHGYGFLVPVSELDAPYAKTIEGMCADNPALLALSERVERSRVDALIALEQAQHDATAERVRYAALHRHTSALEAKVAALEKKLASIEGSRGYQALEGVRNVRRRLRRMREGG